MQKCLVLTAAVCCLMVLGPELARGDGEEATTPEELSRKAYLLDREGRKALYGEDLEGAYRSFTAAIASYEEIARVYPQWRAESVQALLAALRQEAETIGRKIFSLPEGMVEICPKMIREGKRYNDGRVLAGKVKALGGGKYEVESCTVTVVREGPLVGASCTGPDFSYRGSKHGFACKHIWAVVFREKLLGQLSP